MEIKKNFSSAEVLENPELTQEAMSLCGELKYTLTEGEMQWLQFVKDRYCIYDYIIERLDGNILHIDTEFSEAIGNDDCGGKAVCLSDDSALQAIFFYNFDEDCY